MSTTDCESKFQEQYIIQQQFDVEAFPETQDLIRFYENAFRRCMELIDQDKLKPIKPKALNFSPNECFLLMREDTADMERINKSCGGSRKRHFTTQKVGLFIYFAGTLKYDKSIVIRSVKINETQNLNEEYKRFQKYIFVHFYKDHTYQNRQQKKPNNNHQQYNIQEQWVRYQQQQLKLQELQQPYQSQEYNQQYNEFMPYVQQNLKHEYDNKQTKIEFVDEDLVSSENFSLNEEYQGKYAESGPQAEELNKNQENILFQQIITLQNLLDISQARNKSLQEEFNLSKAENMELQKLLNITQESNKDLQKRLNEFEIKQHKAKILSRKLNKLYSYSEEPLKKKIFITSSVQPNQNKLPPNFDTKVNESQEKELELINIDD